MLSMRCSTRILKSNFLQNSTINHFLRFHCSTNFDISRIAICKLLIPSKKYEKRAILHRKQQSAFYSSFIFNDHSQNDALAEKQLNTEPNLAQLGSKFAKPPEDKITTLRSEKLEYAFGKRNYFLLIAMKSDENGNKWIDLSQNGDSNYQKIASPEDAYLLVKAMDKLMSKSMDEEKPPLCQPELVTGGINYDYKLEFFKSLYNNQLQFRICITTIPPNVNLPDRPKRLSLAIELLPSLRNRIAEMLAEIDGTQEIGPIPSPLPKWIPAENVEELNTQKINKSIAATIRRESLDYMVDVEPRHRKIKIVLDQDESANKSIIIVQKFYNDIVSVFRFILKIPLEDAHRLLNGMRILLEQFRKRNIQLSKNRSLICRQIVTGGRRNDYKMEIHLTPNKQFDFKLQTITTGANIAHKPKYLEGPIPVDVFHWLKDKMNEILADGGEFTATENNTNDSIPERNNITLKTEALNFVDVRGRRNALLISMLEREDSGNKFIRLEKQLFFEHFPNIPVPQDANLMVKAMDRLLSKDINEDKPPICQELVKDGLYCDYKLEISTNKDQFRFCLKTITSETSKSAIKPKVMFIPIQLLPLLRDRMAKMLAEFHETEEIGPRPSPLPKWIRENIDETALEISNRDILILRNETLKYMVDVKPRFRWINIALCRGISGHKFIRITQMFKEQMDFKSNINTFPKISVSKDAYSLLNTMCAIQNDLEEKYSDAMQQNNSSVIRRQVAEGGIYYDYLLEIYLRNDQQLEFQMQTIATDASHNPKHLFGPIPIHVFHWLKDQMAEMLIEYELDKIKQERSEEDKLHLSPDVLTD